MKKEKWEYNGKRISFYWGSNFELSYAICGYFDPRPRIHIACKLFHFTFKFWYINVKWADECNPPRYGIGYFGQSFWLYWGGKGDGKNITKTWSVPWSSQWYRTSYLRKDGTWENETKELQRYGKAEDGSPFKYRGKDFWKDEWKDILWSNTVPYEYKLKSGKVQKVNATIRVTEMEHRWKWFMCLPLINRTVKSIDVKFSDQVGEGTGSWKGGVLGCGYNILPNESALACLSRMERERKL